MDDAGYGSAAPGTPAAAVEREASAEDRPARRLGLLASFGIGAGAAILGLLPWIGSGMRLPLQNLWAMAALPDEMPIALLPFSQYAVTLLAGLLMTGAAIAGLVARATAARRGRGDLAAIAVGVLLVQGGAGTQSALVVADGQEQSTRAVLYLAALVAVVILSIAIGVVVLLLAGRSARPGATVAFATAALAAGIWANSLVAPFGSLQSPASAWLLAGTRWVPALLVGAAIAWCGFRSVGRVLAAASALLLLWLGSAAITAVSAAAGTRVLAPYPAEMLDYAAGVFLMASGMPELVLPPLLLALAVGALGAVALDRLRARRGGGSAA
ncbi:hypothetical protein [Naasia sp. SYSU D00057]|uniref:hypothetical protein n=1 Tax=Naasia sp. SYSU D00057 TaxID=2817380 RepID=UPI001B301C17|nr:hypothetical protein [Naasia sp. SYSU D00057]